MGICRRIGGQQAPIVNVMKDIKALGYTAQFVQLDTRIRATQRSRDIQKEHCPPPSAFDPSTKGWSPDPVSETLSVFFWLLERKYLLPQRRNRIYILAVLGDDGGVLSKWVRGVEELADNRRYGIGRLVDTRSVVWSVRVVCMPSADTPHDERMHMQCRIQGRFFHAGLPKRDITKRQSGLITKVKSVLRGRKVGPWISICSSELRPAMPSPRTSYRGYFRILGYTWHTCAACVPR